MIELHKLSLLLLPTKFSEETDGLSYLFLDSLRFFPS
jgi:hypothetical protein